MLGFYKNPKGDRISTFGTRDDVAQNFGSSNDGAIRTLRRRVTELEDTIKKHVSHVLVRYHEQLLNFAIQESEFFALNRLPSVAECDEETLEKVQ